MRLYGEPEKDRFFVFFSGLEGGFSYWISSGGRSWVSSDGSASPRKSFHALGLIDRAIEGSAIRYYPQVTKDRRLLVLIGAVVVTVVLYVVPYGFYIAYPLILLSTYAHEMGHGITALLVGGSFESFVMAPDASGLAYLQIPDSPLARAATSAGGLMGPALLAALFFWLAKRPKSAHIGLLAFGIASLVALVLIVRSAFGWLFVGTLGVGSVYLGIKSTARVAQIVLAFMAVQLSLSVFSRADYLFTESAGAGPSDVAQIADALFLPFWFWGVLCGGASVLVLVLGLNVFLKGSAR